MRPRRANAKSLCLDASGQEAPVPPLLPLPPVIPPLPSPRQFNPPPRQRKSLPPTPTLLPYLHHHRRNKISASQGSNRENNNDDPRFGARETYSAEPGLGSAAAGAAHNARSSSTMLQTSIAGEELSSGMQCKGNSGKAKKAWL